MSAEDRRDGGRERADSASSSIIGLSRPAWPASCGIVQGWSGRRKR